jgi:hypothetical protein
MNLTIICIFALIRIEMTTINQVLAYNNIQGQPCGYYYQDSNLCNGFLYSLAVQNTQIACVFWL